MSGPAPKRLGSAQGHRKRRSAALGPVVAPGLPVVAPSPPSGLLKPSRERWEAFWRSDVARAVDFDADAGRLERWIRAVDEHERAGRELRKQRVVKGSMGQPVLNPLAAYLNQLEAVVAKAEEAFGMTALARMRLGIATGEAAMTAERLNAMTTKGPSADAIDADGYERA